MKEQIKPSKKNTIGLILSWTFGVLFALGGLGGIISSDHASAIAMLIMAAVLLPPITNLINEKLKFHISSGIKTVVIIIGIIVIGTTSETSNVSNTQPTEQQNKNEETVKSKPVNEELPQLINSEQMNKEEKTEIIPKSEKVEISETPTPPSAPNITISQKNAVKSAKAYLSYSAFSYTGLINQLEYEKFSSEDAIYGADNSGADWLDQAAKSAKAYMVYSAFSRDGLIEQLKYEGFTQAQAEHGANTVGL